MLFLFLLICYHCSCFMMFYTCICILCCFMRFILFYAFYSLQLFYVVLCILCCFMHFMFFYACCFMHSSRPLSTLFTLVYTKCHPVTTITFYQVLLINLRQCSIMKFLHCKPMRLFNFMIIHENLKKLIEKKLYNTFVGLHVTALTINLVLLFSSCVGWLYGIVLHPHTGIVKNRLQWNLF